MPPWHPPLRILTAGYLPRLPVCDARPADSSEHRFRATKYRKERFLRGKIIFFKNGKVCRHTRSEKRLLDPHGVHCRLTQLRGSACASTISFIGTRSGGDKEITHICEEYRALTKLQDDCACEHGSDVCQ